MDLLSDYCILPQTKILTKVEEQRNLAFNLLNVSQIQVVKVKRLLSGRLTSSNLTFIEFNQNPELEADQTDKKKNDNQHTKNTKPFDIENYLTFSLISKSILPDYEILIKFSINIKRFTISFQSKILKNHRLVKIQSRHLVKYMARYFMSYNGKLKQGSFFVNPITSEISLFIHNHSSFDSLSNLIRNPQKFLVLIMFYLDQTTIKWNDCLDSVLYLINKKSYDEINPTKKFKYYKEKLKRLSQMIIHSHIDATFFAQNQVIKRFQQISEQERNDKLSNLKNQYDFMQKRSKPLQLINPIIKTYIGERKSSQVKFKFIPWQKPRIKQFSTNLSCHDYRGKNNIYSEIEIQSLISQVCVFESGFSKIYQIEADIKFLEEGNTSKLFLIKKKTHPKRYQNQVSVLKLIQKQKFLFLPRYYFCQQQEHKQSIFIELIPESSMDRYLMSKFMFIGCETKLFFLFMVVIALRFLRDNSIVHIDLKPENVLIKIVGDGKKNVHYLVKLIDFGQSYIHNVNLPEGNSNRGFTIPYAPPELLSKSKRFDEKTDVYSFGVMMFKFIFNHFPTEIMRLSKNDFKEENYLKFYTIPYEKLQTFGTVDLMSLLYYLCLKCVQPNPNHRPTLDWLCIILKDIILTYDELTK